MITQEEKKRPKKRKSHFLDNPKTLESKNNRVLESKTFWWQVFKTLLDYKMKLKNMYVFRSKF